MASRSLTIAEALTTFLNSQNWTTPVNYSDPLAVTAIYPVGRREDIGVVHAYVCIDGRELEPRTTRDRCDPTWRSLLKVVVVAKLKGDNDASEDDPAQYISVDQVDIYLQFAEEIAECIANEKSGVGYALSEVEHTVLIADEELKSSGIFFSQIDVAYR